MRTLIRNGMLLACFWFLVFPLSVIAGNRTGRNLDLIFSDALESQISPMVISGMVTPEINKKIVNDYKTGKYRSAIVSLRRIISMNLPDGRMDYYLFVIAECYHQLELHRYALEYYNKLIEDFHDSPYQAESLFRVLQTYYVLEKDTLAGETYDRIKNEFPGHTMNTAASYLYAKFLAGKHDYSKAISLLKMVGQGSPYYDASRFLIAMCMKWTGKTEAAITLLVTLSKASGRQLIKNECYLTIGHLYHRLGKYSSAIKYYNKVDKGSEQYDLARLKKATVLLSMEKYDDAVKSSRLLINSKEYFFEASLILLNAYWELKDSVQAFDVRNRLSFHVKLIRILMYVEEEHFMLNNLRRQWEAFSMTPFQDDPEKKTMIKLNEEDARKNIHGMLGRLIDIKERLRRFYVEDLSEHGTGMFEKKLLELCEKELTALKEKIQALQPRIAKQVREANFNMLLVSDSLNSEKKLLDSLEHEQGNITNLLGELYVLSRTQKMDRAKTQEMQPKLIDVGMILYERLKKRYHTTNENIRNYRQKRDRFLKQQGKSK
ncbi:MAG: hypothetical protein HQK83_05275 [Fibrobacteria bacterium]|nr:hypothetical protein [Fibrobacteria bacterium]